MRIPDKVPSKSACLCSQGMTYCQVQHGFNVNVHVCGVDEKGMVYFSQEFDLCKRFKTLLSLMLIQENTKTHVSRNLQPGKKNSAILHNTKHFTFLKKVTKRCAVGGEGTLMHV